MYIYIYIYINFSFLYIYIYKYITLYIYIYIEREREREREKERERKKYIIYMLFVMKSVLLYFFLGILPLNSPHPPEGKWLLHPSQGSQTVDFFFIRKIFVHRIGLNLVLAKKNVLK